MVGFFIYKYFLRARSVPTNLIPSGRPLAFLIAVIFFSLLPDMDAMLGIWLNDFGRFHNNWSHSLLCGLIVAIVIGFIARWKNNRNFLTWFIITLLCYEMHVIMDLVTIGRGVKLFWPLSPERYSSPIKLFYGLHWSDGLISARHLLTLITEIGSILIVMFTVNYLKKRKQMIIMKNDRLFTDSR
jgi:inner membrane protein